MRSDLHLRLRRFTRGGEPARRAGFTLIEIMVVLLIIAILMALLLVGVAAVRRTAVNAATIADLNQIEMALNEYKGLASEFPPSAGEWNPADATDAAFLNVRIQRLANHVRKRFPRLTNALAPGVQVCVRTYTTSAGTTTEGSRMLELDMLDAAEAYLFFLNGPPTITTDASGNTNFGFMGFATDPSKPVDQAATDLPRKARVQPLFIPNPSRLVDTDGDGWPEFVPNGQKVPVVYFRGGQYAFKPGTANTQTVSYSCTVNVPMRARPYASRAIPMTGTDPLGAAAPDTWVNPSGVQLIACGIDENLGGTTDANTTAPRVWPFTLSTSTMVARENEKDNLANFYNTTLGSKE